MDLDLWESLRDRNSCPGNVGWFLKNGRKLLTGWQYHLCILYRWTIQHYLVPQSFAIVSSQDRERGRYAIDKNGFMMMNHIKRWQSRHFLVFSSSSCWAQLRKTHSRTWKYHIISCVNTAESLSLSSPFFLHQGVHVRHPPRCGAPWQRVSLPLWRATTSWVLLKGRKYFRGRIR